MNNELYNHKLQIYYFFRINEIATKIYYYLSDKDLLNLLNVKLLRNQRALLKYLPVSQDGSVFKFNQSDVVLNKNYSVRSIFMSGCCQIKLRVLIWKI